MVPLLKNLFNALEAEGVGYCHWKSNAFMADAARGEDDLDLLISPAGRQLFLEILDRLGFKEALTPKGRLQIPGIMSYYGYDETVSRLIHAHVHTKLILGHDLTKNYHLPVENAYLASASRGEFFRLPAPEFEFVVFVIRMMLKHSTWTAILNGQGRLSDRERKELEYLHNSAGRERITETLTKHLPLFSVKLFDDCFRALRSPRVLWDRIKTGHRVQKALRGCRIRTHAVDIWLQFWRRLQMAVKRRILGSIPGKRLKNGGILAAFLGGDGAGKTTAIEGLAAWLSPPFATMTFHLGKPPWSKTTILIRGLLKGVRILGIRSFRDAPIAATAAGITRSFPGYSSLIGAVCVARDRSLSYRKARKRADKGVFVICDRFPLPQAISMDGPRIERMTRGSKENRFIAFLRRLEDGYYRSILPPDLLVVLRTDPETAVGRKTDENPDSVRARSEEIWEKDWKQWTVHVVDANKPKEDVLRRTQRLVWAHL